ncbi:RidA family protein [Aquimarina sp. W85]|uniref:RidA family protein n=1 Tax=Aquimarina rhodophyticola TaxID=3342246 RepID=UPI00366E8DA9
MRLLCGFLLLIGSSCSFVSCKSEVDNVTFFTSHEVNKTKAPFSDIVAVDNLFFLSGQIGMDHKTRKIVEGGIEAETKQTLENIKAVLTHHQMTMDQIVKCTVILKNIEDFAVMNEIYKQYLPQKPARTTFAVNNLAFGALIEIECIAAKM